jgi:Acetyltransferase (GNAT) domain
MAGTSALSAPGYRRDLGDGLLLRWSTAADITQIGELYAIVFRENPEQPPNVRMAQWAADVGSDRHPAAGPDQFAVVEDTRSGLIVAALMVLRQTWSYGGIPFEIGRPEAVACHPDYRNRGLVRAIFELFHARSAEREQLAQGITGIAYFYRQFGYEYAFELEGSRRVPFSGLPKLKEGESEPYTLRLATIADLPLIEELYERERAGVPGNVPLVTTTFDARYWRYIFDGQTPESGQGARIYMIVDQAGQDLGQVITTRLRWGETLAVFGVATRPGAPLLNMIPSVLRGLEQVARETEPWRTPAPDASRLVFVLGDSHPFYDALNANLVSRSSPAYGWYVRVPDLPAFVRRVAPAIERRLIESPLGAYTGELKLDFYRGGLRIVFEQGRITVAEEWQRPIWNPGASAGFPPLVFLQLLFGRRSLDELMHAFPDVWADDDPAQLLRALFPRQRSWALGQD